MKRFYSSVIAMLLVLTAGQAVAQNDGVGDLMRRHEISVAFARPGVGNMPFGGTFGWDKHNSSDFAMGFSAGYTHWFSNHIGLATTASLTYVSNSEKLANITSTAHGTITISNGSGLDRKVNTTMTVNTPMVNETQSLLMLDIPIQLALQHKHLYCNLGLALGFSLNTYGAYVYAPSSYEITAIDDLGIDINTLPLDAVVVEGNKGDYAPASVRYPFFVELAADLGWKFYFDKRNAVSLAFSLRYALNKCNVDHSNYEIINISSDHTTALAPMQAGLVDYFRYYVAGLKVTYHWGCGPAVK
ncbi:MAG: hypothetical protein IJU90_05165 [Bacteroidales bacterium]|nr:hypothetical protein [Bacteroidales bacterium]